MRSVVGLDVTTTAVSIARIREGYARPPVGVIASPVSTEDYSPAANAELAQRFAMKVWNAIEKERPGLVVMNCLNLDRWQVDKSGPRRAGVWWAIATKLGFHSVPVAEGPPVTFLAKLIAAQGVNTPGAAHRLIDMLVPKTWAEVRDMSETRFRYSTLLDAAAGCMALGIQTPLGVTGHRLAVLDKYGTWPENITIEKTEAAWNAKHGGGPAPAARAEKTTAEEGEVA